MSLPRSCGIYRCYHCNWNLTLSVSTLHNLITSKGPKSGRTKRWSQLQLVLLGLRPWTTSSTFGHAGWTVTTESRHQIEKTEYVFYTSVETSRRWKCISGCVRKVWHKKKKNEEMNVFWIKKWLVWTQRHFGNVLEDNMGVSLPSGLSFQILDTEKWEKSLSLFFFFILVR